MVNNTVVYASKRDLIQFSFLMLCLLMNNSNIPSITTLGQLKATGYQPKSIKQELRDNLTTALKNKNQLFTGILGFEDTVLPDLERAILSRHNILLLGLRGQAKTRIARLLTALLDEYIPVVAGTELNDDPITPLSRQARTLIAEHGDDTAIEWLHRSERYELSTLVWYQGRIVVFL